MAQGNLPLARFKVLDLTRVRSGPTAVKVFADWGADVIKIEMPPANDQDDGYTGSREAADFLNLHRNKRSMTLNLKEPDGKAIFFKLLEGADLVVENYRPDVKNRLGIDYESLAKINPRIVLGSISGFGQDGPYGGRPGVDQIAQGMGGFMSVTGLPGQGPVRAGTAIADLATGMNCAMAMLIALLDREVTGKGQWVHTSLLESQIALMDFQAARWLIENEVPPQAGNNHPKSTPTGVFPTKDGHINIAAGGQQMWTRLCKGLGAEVLLDKDEYKDGEGRLAHREQLNAELSEYTATRSSSDWVEMLNAGGVPCGPIYTLDQTFADPQVQHLGIAKSVPHPTRGEIKVVGQPYQMSGSEIEMKSGTPGLGEHTDAVLSDLGYAAADISELRERGVI
ncbi:MAG: CoA transferase [Rhodospirillaceae bacterium]|jgi:crotonobetainyl-CoA:carnitine CoA-transferase CaiB-like acyl-CoA transferase|nr:CoA transferase [Rhodospirillaceae bacterium]MBT5456204.1 CoA transferase [Rhodospirillaceae bacterium]